MSDTMIQTPATAQTTSSSGALKACSRTGCKWSFLPGTGYVPGLETLYKVARNTGVTPARPLTRTEVLEQEFCASCKKLATFRVFATQGTLQLMEHWAEENIERKETSLDRKAAFEKWQRARALAFAIRNEDRHKMNEIFATAKLSTTDHKHKRRSRALRRLEAAAPRPMPEPKKGKKQKQKSSGTKGKRGK